MRAALGTGWSGMLDGDQAWLHLTDSDETYLYGARSFEYVVRVARSDGRVDVIDSGVANCTTVRREDTAVVWVDDASDKNRRLTRRYDNGSREVLFEAYGLDCGTVLSLDGAYYVRVAEFVNQASLVRVGPESGVVETLTTARIDSAAVHAGNNFYWFVVDEDLVRLFRVALGGGDPEEVATYKADGAYQIAADDRFVYLAVYEKFLGSSIVGFPVDGGDWRVIVEGLSPVARLAADHDRIAWARITVDTATPEFIDVACAPPH